MKETERGRDMQAIKAYVGSMKEIFDLEKKTVSQIRQEYASLKPAELPLGATVETVTVANLPAEWVRAANVPAGSEQVILYLHGGGFYCGNCDTHSNFAALISAATGVQVLLSDSTRLAARAKAAGIDVSLEVWENMWHVFQTFAAIVPEAREALDHIGKFVRNISADEILNIKMKENYHG
ncbi:hypothetical protein SPSIL_036260 [Sporomusa silvacetica DSM 10669]|uniref:Alpha/beta hydrolase fold-3 domain-containing protein n=1 Tax=Sporomusa silvacetica DSM 10669 TaxID=1123289 RepID=A0ABZ3INX2_9FIRM|nr:alpha/beta hydrolase [Sporomusa silvacetica]OZC19809.1 carboxylesterase LipF [Sporomusa silvacetica DSM 10669]